MGRRKQNPDEILTMEEKFCRDAYLLNGDVDKAYTLSRRNRIKTDNQDTIHRMALRWLRSEYVKKYLNERSILLQDRATEGNKPKAGRRDKDAIVSELNILADATKDPKQKTEILMKLADLQQMKKDVTKEEEDNTIHYYLPLNCRNCELYIKRKQDGGYNALPR